MIEQVQTLAEAAGRNWLIALGAAFAAIVLDAAKPKTPEGGQVGGPLAWLATIANLAMPFLLVVHGFWAGVQAQNPLALAIALGIVVAVVTGASLAGMLAGLLIPAIRRVVGMAAPFAVLAAFAFTLWVTFAAAKAVLQLYVLQNLAA